jgi:hypothetical protein
VALEALARCFLLGIASRNFENESRRPVVTVCCVAGNVCGDGFTGLKDINHALI